MWALQLCRVLAHTQASFDLCDTTSLARRYHYSHFTEEEIEASRGSVVSHRIVLSPNPTSPVTLPESLCTSAGGCGLCPAEGQPESLLNSITISGNQSGGSWERAPHCALPLSGSLEDSEVKRRAGARGWAHREVWFLRAARKAGWGGSTLAAQGGRAPGCQRATAPASQPPGSRGVTFKGQPSAYALAEDVFLPGGQNISGTFRRGLNTLSTLAALGIPGWIQVCFHMQQD